MPRFLPLLDRHFEHQIKKAYDKELLGEYARQRIIHCGPREVMELFFRAPVCEDCIPNHSSWWADWPTITPQNWKDDILWELGEAAHDSIVAELVGGEHCAFTCFHCGRDLQPWEGNEVYIVREHWEEYHGIPTETPNRVNPSSDGA